MDYKLIIKEILAGKLEKIYFLHGEEAYFIDEITRVITENALEEHERDFNQTILYGKDAEALSLISEFVIKTSQPYDFQEVLVEEVVASVDSEVEVLEEEELEGNGK